MGMLHRDQIQGRGIILAAHGAGDNSPANAVLRGFADRLAAEDGTEAVAAFKLGRPSFAEALDHISATDVTVVPVMTSDGWYVRTVLPRELARSPRFHAVRLRYTLPVGLHPAIAAIIADIGSKTCATTGLDPETTALVIVGHGTQRSAHSRNATLRLCGNVRKLTAFRRVRPAFLDEPPYVQDVPAHVGEPNLLVIPFLIGGGDHALRDIPERLGWTVASDTAATGKQAPGASATDPPVPLDFALPDGRRCVFAGALADHLALFEIIRALAAQRGGAPAVQIGESRPMTAAIEDAT